MNGKKVFLYYMTRKRRVRRRRRTQKGKTKARSMPKDKPKAKSMQKGGKPLRINPAICKGLPSLVNGLEYDSIQTVKYVKDQAQTDYKAFFDGTCYPPYVVSTTHMSGYTLKGSFILMKNPEKVSMVIDKWMKWIQPISKEMFSSSLVGIRSNINPFKTYYDQLQMYKTALENKKSMIVKALTADTEILASEENIKGTLQTIQMKYNYYNDIPFNMKEFLGFEKMSGWFGTEAARIKGMQEMDEEVKKLVKPSDPKPNVLDKIKEENEKKKEASKATLVLTTYVFYYLNRATNAGSLEQILGVLNKLYAQINSFSDVKGTPEESMVLIRGFVEKFPVYLGELKTAMGSQRGGAFLKVIRTKTKEIAKQAGTGAKGLLHKGASVIAERTKPNVQIEQGPKPEPIKYYVKSELEPTTGKQPIRQGELIHLPSKPIGKGELNQSRDIVTGNSENSMFEELYKLKQDEEVSNSPPGPVVKSGSNLASTVAGSETMADPVAKQGPKNTHAIEASDKKNPANGAKPESIVNGPKANPGTAEKDVVGGAPTATIDNSNKPAGYVYEHSIHHLYQPMNQDPFNNFYIEIQKDNPDRDKLYGLIPELKGGVMTFEILEAYLKHVVPVAESKADADEANEEKGEAAEPKGEVAEPKGEVAEPNGEVAEAKGEAKGVEESKGEQTNGNRKVGGAVQPDDLDLFRAKLHFFMYPLYVLMKQLQKDIGHKENSKIELSSYAKNEPMKNRLSDFKEYLKETIRGQPLVSFYPLGLKSSSTTDTTYRFVRVYNSYEYNYAKQMFDLNKIALENKFVNTAYLNGHGFVFVEDPSFLSLHKAYYYDTEDYSNGTTFEKPDLETKPKFAIFGESKKPGTKQAYAIPGKEPTGLATTVVKGVDGVLSKIPMTDLSKGLLAAGKQTVENTAFLAKEAGKGIGTGISGAGDGVSSTYESGGDYGVEKFVADTNPFDTKQKRLEKAAAKIREAEDEAKKTKLVGGRVTRGNVIGKMFPKTVGAVGYAGTKTVDAAKYVGTPIVDAVTKTVDAAKYAGTKTVDAVKYVGPPIGDAAKYAGTKSGNLLGGIVSLGWVPFELLVRLSILPVILTGLSMKSVAGYFSAKLDNNSYLNMNKMAKEKAAECEQIAKLLRTNWAHAEHTRTQQNVLQVLSNLYANVEYIEQQEIAFRDLHEYPIETFKTMVGNLISRVSDPLFEKGKLYPLLKDTKKMTYVVYRMLQECVPITLSDRKSELLGEKKGPTSELEIKLEDLKKQLAEEAKFNKATADKATFDKDSKDKPLADKAAAVIADSTSKIAQLKADIKDLASKKVQFDALNSDLKEEPAALDANDKIIKEMLKKAPTITFKPEDITAINNLFDNAKPVVSKRYSSGVNRPLTERFDLMPELSVSIVAPTNAKAPALASLFVYDTGVDPDQAEKNKAAEEKQKRRDKDKAATDTKMLEMSKIRSTERMKQQEERSKLETERLKQTGLTQRAQVSSDTQLKLKDKEIANKLREIQAEHKAAVDTSRLQQKREMKKISREIAEAKRKDTAESKREVLRLEADKKRSEAQYRGELNKLKTELIASIEKIKPGEGQKEAAAMDLGSEPVTSEPVTSEPVTNTTKATTKTTTNTTKAANMNAGKTVKTNTNTGKKGTQKSRVCVKHNERNRCYVVKQNGQDISIEADKK